MKEAGPSLAIQRAKTRKKTHVRDKVPPEHDKPALRICGFDCLVTGEASSGQVKLVSPDLAEEVIRLVF